MSKETILNSIKEHKSNNVPPLPSLETIDGITFEDKLNQFSEALKSVGGEAVVLDNISKLKEKIQELYPEAKKVICNINECDISDDAGNEIRTPHEHQDVDLAVVSGEFAVAENGAVWVKNSTNRHRALYFLAENIVLVVDKESVVNNMHEAYERINFDDKGYGVFVSGPSKTADIEQSLVIGAHGPKSGYVFLV